MVQQKSAPAISRQQLTDTLGHDLTQQEFSGCLKKIKSLAPKVGLFWQSTEAEAGIYIVTTGKARILNQAGDLISTLEAGASFGECSLFPETSFQPYSVRVSVNVKLCYLPPELLFSLIRQHPEIRDHLYQQAQARNSLLTEEEPLPGPPDPAPSPSPVNQDYFPKPTQRAGHLLQRVTRRYPSFIQQSSSDCGAACLVMVARYWGKRFSVNRLRDIANVDRNGASLRGLSAAAESIGFTTRPVKASLDQLGKQKLPAIVHWEGKHYVVVYEVTRKHVVIADPAIGQRRLSHAEFNEGWTSYALLLQPTALLSDATEDRTRLWQFFELLKPHGLVLLEIFIASIFIQVFALITPSNPCCLTHNDLKLNNILLHTDWEQILSQPN